MRRSSLPLIRAALLLAFLAVLAGSLRSEARPRAPRAAAPPAVTATILHSFSFTSGGTQPGYGLTQGPDGSLYGITSSGPDTAASPGIVFQIAPDGTYHILHQFISHRDGYATTAKLLLVGTQLFGTCIIGGVGDLVSNSGNGSVFVIDLAKVSPADNAAGFSVIHYFGNSPDQPDGAGPAGALLLASDGNLYGTTAFGAPYSSGTIFQIKPDADGHFSVTPRATSSGLDTFNGTYTLIYDFRSDAGAAPHAGVVQGPGGFLYGTTQGGGPVGAGTVYKVSTDGKGFTLLHTFTADSNGNTTEGASLQSVPLFASDGNLYGTAIAGGTGQGLPGTLFQIKPGADGVFGANAPFQVLHNFRVYPDGGQPDDGLIQASDGNLYGATRGGGEIAGSSHGSIFRITASGGQFSTASLFTTIYSFDINGNTPNRVSGPLIQGIDGRLYDETANGGPGGAGTAFALDAGLPAPPSVTSVAGSIVPPDITTADTTLVVHGKNFIAGDTVAIDGQDAPVTARDYSKADELITVTLSSPLSAGAHTVVVADAAPDLRVSSPATFLVTLLVPQIIQITRGGGGSVTTVDTKLIIHGHSFAPGDTVDITLATDPTTRQVTVDSGSQLTVTLSQPLPLGHHDVTVTHAAPDGRTSAPPYDLLVVTDAPVISAVSGSLSPPAVTTVDTTLIVHGTHFAATDSVVLAGTSASVTVAGRDLSNPADEQITVTLSQTLPAGSYTARVPHGMPDTSTPFSFTVVAAAAPTLTSTTYRVLNGQGVLNISGTGFVRTGTTRITPNDSNVKLGGTLVISFVSSTQLTATFSQPLPAGVYTLTETNPDTKTARISVYVLAVISAVDDPTGPSVTILGAGFSPGTAVIIGDASNGSVILPLHITADATQIVVDLLNPLPPGSHTFTVTNPDGQTADATLKVLAPVTGMELTVNSSVPDSGVKITPLGDGFSGTAKLMQINPDPNSLPLPGPPAPRNLPAPRAARAPAATSNSPIINDVRVQVGLDSNGQVVSTHMEIDGSNFDATQNGKGQTRVTVDGQAQNAFTYSGSAVTVGDANTIMLDIIVISDNAAHTLLVTNPDGKASQVVSFGVVYGHFALGHLVNGSYVPGSFTPLPTTSYQVTIQEASLVGPGTSIGALAESLPGSDFQKAALASASIIASGGGNLIPLAGANIIATGGGNIVAQGGGNIVAQGGGNFKVPLGAPIIAQGGGNFFDKNGNRIVATGGGNLITNDGGSLISQDGAGLRVAGGNVLTGAGAGPPGFRAFAPLGASPAATSNGFMDVTLFVTKGSQGMRLLVTRYTPGERDLILYKDPSVTVTPSAGTPTPVAAVTAGVVVTRGPVTRDPRTHQPFQVLTLTNTGAGVLSGPFLLAMTGLPAGVTVAGPSGVVAGSPAVAAPGSALAPGASVKVRVDFSDPTNARFSYGVAVYAGL